MLTKIKNIFHLLSAIFFSVRYGFPGKKLKVIGVTGTDGKTTTSFYIYNILTTAGKKTGLITTIEARVGNESYDTGFHVTTPDAKSINKFLKLMVDRSCEYVVIETTSHGIDQHRIFGIPFTVGVITNVTRDHLDYHKTYERYLATKAKLIINSQIAVINKDDSSFKYLKNVAKGKVVSYGLSEGAEVSTKDLGQSSVKMAGSYNYLNALAATAAASSLGISKEFIIKGIENLKYLPGRMEMIQKKPFEIIVDFAHTPNALEQALKSVKSKQSAVRIISVFGCAGLRDNGKRPLMGKVADEFADIVILTAEDPRTENLDTIIDQISGGIKNKRVGETLFKINDRKEAITYAIQKLAKPGDIVLITGKGHEQSMCFGNIEYPWSDKKAVLDVIKPRAGQNL